MSQRRAAVLVASLLTAACVASTAAAQSAPPAEIDRGLKAAGDFSVVWGPRDADAFFNYTDYRHNLLRLARLRLAAEWRVRRGVSFLGQVQAENTDDVDVIAAYVRWRPWTHRGVVVQAGRIPPVVGAYARRAYGADNAVIGSPLAYQYLTLLRNDALPETMDDVLRMRGRGWQPSFPVGSAALRPGVPLVSPRWDTGIEASWRRSALEVSGAITMGAPSQPRLRATNDGRQWSGRAAWHFPAGITAAVSGARGSWLDRGVLALVAADRRRSSQSLVGADVEIGRGRWLLRSEWLRAGFDVPLASGPTAVAHLTAASAFAELRYRPHPRWQVGMRVERLAFSHVPNALDGGSLTPWDAPVSRIETVVGFRVLRTVDLRAGWQQDWRAGGRIRERGYPALQALVRF